jgi:hypothetical protein
MTPDHHYRKNDLIWWHASLCSNRPDWIPKAREWQAGWIKEVNTETGVAFIIVLNEGRKEEIYATPLAMIRPRHLFY